jgi:hypothetical protein
MKTPKHIRRLLAGSALALLPVLPAAAAPTLAIVPQGPTNFTVGQVGAQVTFDVQIQGLGAGEVLSFYDFGIISDPTVILLSSVSGFTSRLGDASANNGTDPTEVYNRNHLDETNDPSAPSPVTGTDCGGTGYFATCNSLWNYTQADVDLGAYVGPTLANGPVITSAGAVNQGSLRFYQASSLDEATLQSLQNVANGTFTLFSLTFDVITDAVASTPILFVDDRDYANYDPVNGPFLMNVALNDPFEPQYLQRTGSQVVIAQAPVPATALLLLPGLVGMARLRRRR